MALHQTPSTSRTYAKKQERMNFVDSLRFYANAWNHHQSPFIYACGGDPCAASRLLLRLFNLHLNFAPGPNVGEQDHPDDTTQAIWVGIRLGAKGFLIQDDSSVAEIACKVAMFDSWEQQVEPPPPVPSNSCASSFTSVDTWGSFGTVV
ncbi:hypothetical protein FGLOB1_13959 [Fusarium globosum]|uniref:Uncharacterized protein n=1 Tax=Fusarium globosum TaxID=78864 RepID=A0A8H6CXD7_9HYPO|nr:hypothetical protein FGLOB1_13959 [Fusarium globosum]